MRVIHSEPCPCYLFVRLHIVLCLFCAQQASKCAVANMYNSGLFISDASWLHCLNVPFYVYYIFKIYLYLEACKKNYLKKKIKKIKYTMIRGICVSFYKAKVEQLQCTQRVGWIFLSPVILVLCSSSSLMPIPLFSAHCTQSNKAYATQHND